MKCLRNGGVIFFVASMFAHPMIDSGEYVYTRLRDSNLGRHARSKDIEKMLDFFLQIHHFSFKVFIRLNNKF